MWDIARILVRYPWDFNGALPKFGGILLRVGGTLPGFRWDIVILV